MPTIFFIAPLTGLPARADFAAGSTLAGSSTALSLSKARHHVDLGELQSARALLGDSGWTVYRGHAANLTVALYDVVLARYHLAEGNDPTSHLESLRAWSSRTGDMDCAIEAHLLSARHLLSAWDLQAAVVGRALSGMRRTTPPFGAV